jgi:hypothetical protein
MYFRLRLITLYDRWYISPFLSDTM